MLVYYCKAEKAWVETAEGKQVISNPTVKFKITEESVTLCFNANDDDTVGLALVIPVSDLFKIERMIRIKKAGAYEE